VSPLPYVRGQVIFLAVLISVSGVLGAGALAVPCGAVALAWMLGLRRKYGRDVYRAETETPRHRARLDRVVARDALLSLPPAILLSAVFIGYPLDSAPWLEVVRSATAPFTIAWTVVYASSLFDWYLILPRVSGQLGYRPCRAAEEEERFSFPSTWKEVTRWWYIHRAAGTLAFRIGLILAVGALAGALSDFGLLAKAFAWSITLAFGAYAAVTIWRGATLAGQVGQAGHVKGIVGQTVTVERRAGRRHPWLPWRELPALQVDGRRYVVDVALESVQLAEVEPREQENLPNPPRFEKDVDSVPLSDVDAIRQAQPKFSGCMGRCSGINWYCIENPRCFDPK
jgi:hypothetical protein